MSEDQNEQSKKLFEDPTTEQLEELKAAYGDDLRLVEYDDLTLAIALPTEDAKVGAYYKRFSDFQDAGKKEEAYKSLFPAMAVYPDQDTIKRLIKRRPGVVRMIGLDCAMLLGLLPSEAKKA